jgi:hypothetical protein
MGCCRVKFTFYQSSCSARSRLRHSITSLMVAGSIPDSVIWNSSLTQFFRSHYGPGVNSASNKNEYQECFLGGKDGRRVGLSTLPHSCAGCLETWEPQTSGTLRACREIALPFSSPVLTNLLLCRRTQICKSSSQYTG